MKVYILKEIVELDSLDHYCNVSAFFSREEALKAKIKAVKRELDTIKEDNPGLEDVEFYDGDVDNINAFEDIDFRDERRNYFKFSIDVSEAEGYPHIEEDILLVAKSYMELDKDKISRVKEGMEYLVNRVLDFDYSEYNEMIEYLLDEFLKEEV